MRLYILPPDQEQHQKELKDNIAIPKSHYGSHIKTKLKIPSGLTIVQRDYPIGAHTMTRSKAHITGSKTDISQIPRDDVEEEGGDTEKRLIGSPQPQRVLHNHLTKHKHGDLIVLIVSLLRLSRCMVC